MAVLLAGVWLVRSRNARPEPSLVAVPLTTYPGWEGYPSFSPDGTQVASVWCPDIRVPNCHIYIKQVGVEPPFQLTDKPEADDGPAWSPDGQTVAFLRFLTPTRAAVVLIPQRGGHERVLEEHDLGLSRRWARRLRALPRVDPGLQMDRLSLAGRPTGLGLVSDLGGDRWKRRLTNPPADPYAGDSPSGVFARRPHPGVRRTGFARCDIYLLRLAEGYRPQGEPQRKVSNNVCSTTPAWTPDGRELVFSSAGLWRIPAESAAGPRRLAFAPDQAFAPTISRRGNRLAYVVPRGDWNIWRVDLHDPGLKPGNPVQFIASTKSEEEPWFSPDGKSIAFVSDRSGSDEIWLCDADGSNSVQLTSFGGAASVLHPRWSLDGGDIGFSAAPVISGQTAQKVYIYLVSTKGGKPRRLTAESASLYEGHPYWSRDGRWIYFISDRSGRIEVWRMPSKGGEAVQITLNEADKEEISPDGKFLYYSKGWPRQVSLWRMPVEGGEEIKVLDSVDAQGQWALGRQGVYFVAPPDKQGHGDIRLYEFSTGKIRKILTIERAVGEQIAVSPDERTILYPQLDEAGSGLMMVENFQ